MTRTPIETVLCVNTGSSSVKCAIYRVADDREQRVDATSVEEIGDGALDDALAALGAHDEEVTAVGHRVVHGGPHHDRPAIIDDALLADLRAAAPFAPLHQGAALDAIAVLARRYPHLRQVACFDTAFHRTMPEVSWRLAVPRALAERGVRRYGFHGLSYEYIVSAIGAETLGRAVIAHLGGGASLVALRDGHSVHTTMGLTPSGGLVMGHRSGDLDPGVLVFLTRELGYDAEHLEQLVDGEAGLLGISGCSADMRTLLAHRDAGDEHAAIAIEIFCTAVRMQIGAYVALLGGIDMLVFTGGIGAHAAAIRGEVCHGLECLGITIDEQLNAAPAPTVSVPGSPVTVRVLETNEDLMIARHTHATLAG